MYTQTQVRTVVKCAASNLQTDSLVLVLLLKLSQSFDFISAAATAAVAVSTMMMVDSFTVLSQLNRLRICIRASKT